MPSSDAKKVYDRERYTRLRDERRKKLPPHPITKLSETDKAYIAGLIDGEGAIYSARNREKTWYPTISISMTSEGVLRWLTQKTGGEKIQTTVRKNDGRYKSILKTIYSYRVTGKTAKLLCSTILPYLRVKANHARVVCAFPVDARIAPGHKIARTEINMVRERLTEQLTALNENRYKRRHRPA